MTTAPPTGFWAQATRDPDRTVLIAPDGEEWTAGRLHADANRLVHGLRAAGLARGWSQCSTRRSRRAAR